MSHPENYYRYFELFNNEEFWEAQEALEDLWKETEHDVLCRGLATS